MLTEGVVKSASSCARDLPAGPFCVASLGLLDASNRLVLSWNGGYACCG